MPSRPTWKGYLRLNLVSVPVETHTTLVTGRGEIHLNQLHAACHSRIRYQKTCPIHGEVPKDEIVMGYQYERDRYVEVTEQEREQAHVASDKAIGIDRLVPLDSIDPIYFTGRNYYLLPDGPAAQRPYALFVQAMEEEERAAVGRVALSGRDQVVVVRAKNGLLIMDLLNYESQLKSQREFIESLPDVKANADEMRLAKMLLESTFDDDPHFDEYHDTYTEKIHEIVAAKVEGHRIITPPAEEAPPVINLMDALRRSVEERQKQRTPSKPGGAKRTRRKRKSS